MEEESLSFSSFPLFQDFVLSRFSIAKKKHIKTHSYEVRTVQVDVLR